MKHLDATSIDEIALSLDEDVYGANGELTDKQILTRLIMTIHIETNYQYIRTGLLPVEQVAALIKSVWEYKDRESTKLLAESRAAAAAGLSL
jgi:hypothetical protein